MASDLGVSKRTALLSAHSRQRSGGMFYKLSRILSLFNAIRSNLRTTTLS